MISERTIRDAAVALLRARGHIVLVNGVAPGRIQERGLGDGSPDVVVLVRPLFSVCFLEFKRDAKQKLRPSQQKWHARHRAIGLGDRIRVVWTVQMAIDAVLTVEREVRSKLSAPSAAFSRCPSCSWPMEITASANDAMRGCCGSCGKEWWMATAREVGKVG